MLEESSDEGSTSSQGTIHRRGRNQRNSKGSPISPRTTLNAYSVQARRLSVSRQNVDKFIVLPESPDRATEMNDVNGTRQMTSTAQRSASPAPGMRYSHRPTASLASKHAVRSLLPDVTRISFRLPWVQFHLHVNLDCRTLGEDMLLLGALIFAIWRFDELRVKNELWLIIGEYLRLRLSCLS